MIPVLVVTVLILLNALFVAAEFAIVGAPRATIERLARKGNPLARAVHSVLRDARQQDRYIATAQLGITTASLGLGMYSEHQLAEWLVVQLEAWGPLRWIGAHAVASALAIGILTYLHVVIGEMVPKSLAMKSPASVAMTVAVPMHAVELVVYPLVLMLNGLGNATLRLFGIERTAGGEERHRTTDELSLIVAESGAGGMLAREQTRIIQELLEFGALTAGAVMVPRTRMVALPLGADGATVRRTAVERHTRYPVYVQNLDDILGVVHVKDLAGLAEDGRLQLDHVRPVPFVPATEPLDRVLAVMAGSKAHLAVVMDEHGGTAGIVSLEDLFEEVVGEMGDVGEVASLRRDEEGALRASGTMRLEDLGEALGLVLEHEEVSTVSGLVLAMLGRPPVVGDRVVHEDVELEVTAVRGRGVHEVKVVRAPDPV